IVELQDFEHRLDPRMPTGEEIVDAYVSDLKLRCERYDGRIFVAEVDGEVAGYAAVMTRVRSEELEDGGMEYGLVADLAVLNKFRRRGIGRRLMQIAERHALDREVRWLRVGVLAANQSARELYALLGFHEYQLQLEKDLAASD
ncbi:MAG: GNAT family N-acetyltransferase, partial [Gammaproteobacteria bacterium]|nr:GNAT family N-acetyltransferase [Gammaproteobacteria bacterium]